VLKWLDAQRYQIQDQKDKPTKAQKADEDEDE